MDGQIIQQRSSYRQGLVLGLTMAEIMLLLVFCLLIAMATYLRSEQVKRVTAENALQAEQSRNERDRDLVATLRDNGKVIERLRDLSGSNDPAAIDQFWRELVDSRTTAAELEKKGTSLKEVRDSIDQFIAMKSNGIDAQKALHDAEVVSAIDREMADATGSIAPTVQSIVDTIKKGKNAGDSIGHQWPPIITLNEANGYSFKIGSAELTTPFREALLTKTASEIAAKAKEYDVDVLEVVGHTDEQPFGNRRRQPEDALTQTTAPPVRQSKSQIAIFSWSSRMVVTSRLLLQQIMLDWGLRELCRSLPYFGRVLY